eukprot:SAG11_NODE_40883_length_199_cov_39.390000_1_plen_52_part_01
MNTVQTANEYSTNSKQIKFSTRSQYIFYVCWIPGTHKKSKKFKVNIFSAFFY